MKIKLLHFFKVVLFGAFLFSNSLQLSAQQMDYTPYEELPSIQKILKPTYSDNIPDWGKMLYQYPVNYYDINKAYSAWEKANPGIKTALSRYFKLWRMQLEPYATSNGTIEMPNVTQINENLKNAQSSSSQMKKVPAVGNTSNWTFWGPKQTFWLNESGSATAPAAAPWQANVYSLDVTLANPNVLYIGTETGFVNKSINKGLTWNISGKNYVFGGSVTAIAIHPSNPDTAYVSAGGTIHRTLNGGTTWARTGAAFGADRLKIDPRNTSKLIAVGSTGLWVSTNKSTAWTKRATTPCWDVEFKPNSSDTIYAVSETATHFIKIIQSFDGGLTFSDVSTFPTTVPQVNGGLIGMTASNPNIMYVAILSRNASAQEVPFLYKGTLANGIWTWVLKYTGFTGLSSGSGMTNGQGYFDFVLEVSPTNENILFMGTTSLFKSINGGTTLTAVGGYQGPLSIHPDIQDMKMLSNGDIWVATDGGVSLIKDDFESAASYTPLVNGIIGSNIWGFDQGWNEDLIVSGRYHNGNTAIADFYGDKALRMGGGESATGWIVQGKSRQAAFNDLGNGWILPKTAEGKPEGRFTFSKYPNMDEYGALRSNILTHPNYSGTMYVASDSTLWISKDYGVSYDLLYKFTNGKIRYIANSISNPNVMYADIIARGFYKSTNGGASWTLTSSSGAPAWNAKMTFAISPYNSEIVYACKQVGAWDSYNSEIYRSPNGGTTWYVWSNLGKSVKSIVIQPTKTGKDLVYACTTSVSGAAASVYFRKDGDAAWTEYGTNFPASMGVQVAVPFFRDSKLRVAGNGGVWESPLAETDFTPILVPWVDYQSQECISDTIQLDDHSLLNHAGTTWNWEISPAPSYISNPNIRNPKIFIDQFGKYTVTMKVTQNGTVYTKVMTDFFEKKSCPAIDCSAKAELPRKFFRLISADSFESGNEPANAFDGNLATIWHTSWTKPKAFPHEIQIDLGQEYNVSQFTYTGRQSGTNGMVKNYTLYISNDKVNWGTAAKTGVLINTIQPQTVTFTEKLGRYARFVATSEVNNYNYTSAAEISFLGCSVNTATNDIVSDERNVKSFPIPAKSNLRISLPFTSGSTLNYAIYSSNGQQIESKKMNSNGNELTIDVINFKAGSYFVNITDNNGVTYRAKFIKQ